MAMIRIPTADVLRRIQGEYLEMPGMILTPEQGARLWALPPRRVLELLDRLVQEGFLRRHPLGGYLRT